MSESEATDTNENRTAEKKSVSGFFTAVTEFLRITFEQIGSLGDSGIDSGQLWSVEISESGNVSKPRQIGTFSDLSWPVISADGSVIYALQRGKLVMLTDDDHSIEVIDSRLRWRKLLGIAQDGSVLALVYDEGETLPTLVKPGGEARVEQSPLSPEQQTQVSLLTQESRSYSDGRRLLVDRSERGGRGFDLYMEVGSDRINVSDCGHHRCGQGSISPDFRRILYIRKPRY